MTALSRFEAFKAEMKEKYGISYKYDMTDDERKKYEELDNEAQIEYENTALD